MTPVIMHWVRLVGVAVPRAEVFQDGGAFLCSTPLYSNRYLFSTAGSTQSQAVPQWSNWQASSGQAKVGHGVQGIPRINGQLHERTGIATCMVT